mgnify:CR=1 FL=1
MEQLEQELYNHGNISKNELLELLNTIDFTKLTDDDKKQKKNRNRNYCSDCDKENTLINDYSNGVSVCNLCGQVNDNIFDSNPEWRNYDGDTSKARCSSITNPLLPKSSLGTSIGGYSRKKVKNLHSWDSMPYDERSLNIVLKDITHRCTKYNILKCIIDDAKIMYKWVSSCKHKEGKNKGKKYIIRGANRKSLIAACVFFACKRKGETRSPKEIAKIFDLKFTDATKGLKTFIKLIKIHTDKQINLGDSSSKDFISRFCKNLNINKKFIEDALNIATNVDLLNVAQNHTPISIATGSILLMIEMHNLDISRKKLSEEFKVSEVTITKTYKTLQPYKNILIDNKKVNIILKNMKKEKEMEKLSEQKKKEINKHIEEQKNNTYYDDIVEDVQDTHDTFEDQESLISNLTIDSNIENELKIFNNRIIKVKKITDMIDKLIENRNNDIDDE